MNTVTYPKLSIYLYFCSNVYRLTAVAGDKLRYNNPGIADLSDEYRPNKLAEKFSELYDNEWTELYEDLDRTGNDETTRNSEENIIGQLLQLLRVKTIFLSVIFYFSFRSALIALKYGRVFIL